MIYIRFFGQVLRKGWRNVCTGAVWAFALSALMIKPSLATVFSLIPASMLMVGMIVEAHRDTMVWLYPSDAPIITRDEAETKARTHVTLLTDAQQPSLVRLGGNGPLWPGSSARVGPCGQEIAYCGRRQGGAGCSCYFQEEHGYGTAGTDR